MPSTYLWKTAGIHSGEKINPVRAEMVTEVNEGDRMQKKAKKQKTQYTWNYKFYS